MYALKKPVTGGPGGSTSGSMSVLTRYVALQLFHGTNEISSPLLTVGREVISARFVHPSEALRAHSAKEMTFMPPSITSSAPSPKYCPETRVSRANGNGFDRSLRGFREDGRCSAAVEAWRWEVVLAYRGDELADGPVVRGIGQRSSLDQRGEFNRACFGMFAEVGIDRFQRRSICRGSLMCLREGGTSSCEVN